MRPVPLKTERKSRRKKKAEREKEERKREETKVWQILSSQRV
jgi:hypothetical protein